MQLSICCLRHKEQGKRTHPLPSSLYLTHEPADDAVKTGALVTETFLSGAQSPEVFCKIKININNSVPVMQICILSEVMLT